MSNSPLGRDEVVSALVERIRAGGADALGFDALMRERIDDQWKRFQKDSVESSVNAKVHDAMRGYTNRVFSVAGLIGIALVGAFLTRAYNWTQPQGIAQEIISQLKSDEKSELVVALKHLETFLEDKKTEINTKYDEIRGAYDNQIKELNDLKTETASFSESRRKMLEITGEIDQMKADIDKLKSGVEENREVFKALQGVSMLTKAELQEALGKLNDEEKKKFVGLLSSLIPIEEAQLRVQTCDSGYNLVESFRYAGKTAIDPEVKAVVCLSDDRKYLGKNENDLIKALGAN